MKICNLYTESFGHTVNAGDLYSQIRKGIMESFQLLQKSRTFVHFSAEHGPPSL